MSCITLQANRLETDIKLKVNNSNKCSIKVNKFLHSIFKINTILSIINGRIKLINDKPLVKATNLSTLILLKTKTNTKISVNAEIVCSTSISDDLEMWWCNGWKVLWNNKIKALWPEE